MAILVVFSMLALVLLIWPQLGLARPAVVAAALALAMGGANPGEVLGDVGQRAGGALIVLTGMVLAARHALGGAGADALGLMLARIFASRALGFVHPSIRAPLVLLPAAMALATLLHNVGSVVVLWPVARRFAEFAKIPIVPLAAGLIPATNVGGATAAAGDAPAILQREAWGFDGTDFVAAMLPRNAALLLIVVAMVGTVSYLIAIRRSGRERNRISETAVALALLDEFDRPEAFRNWRQAAGLAVLALLVAAQLGFLGDRLIETHAAGLAILLGISTDWQHDLTSLGAEGIVSMLALFVLGRSATEALPELMPPSGGVGVIFTAYSFAAALSADGAAAVLTPIVHDAQPALAGAWALASGICAGSTFALTSASAGPVLLGLARADGVAFTFRTYLTLGIPISLGMLGFYLAWESAL